MKNLIADFKLPEDMKRPSVLSWRIDRLAMQAQLHEVENIMADLAGRAMKLRKEIEYATKKIEGGK